MGHNAGEFCWALTMPTLYDDVGPKIKAVLETELEIVFGYGCEVDADDIREAMEKAELVKAFLVSYVDGIAAMLCVQRAGFYGDQSAKDEVKAQLGPGGEDLRKRSIEDTAKAFLESIPGGFVLKNRDKV